VSDSHDQSYYEIALTNRQVMSIFVVLLICVLASFLGGVWLGRDADASVQMASTQSIVAAEEGDGPLEELDFFTRRNRAANNESAQSRDDQAPQRLEELEPVVTARIQAAEKRKLSSGAPAQSPAGQTDGAPSPPAARSAAKLGSQTSAGTGASGAGPRDPATPAPVPDAVVIQVFSSNEEAQARRVVDRLVKGGYPAVLSPVEVAGRILHRVRIGPYTDSDEARVVAESVRRTYRLETWITR